MVKSRHGQGFGEVDSRNAADIFPELAEEFSQTNPSWGKEDKSISDLGDFVSAKNLSHIKVQQVVHLWQYKDGFFKSLTNSPCLMLLEKNLDFNELEFFVLMANTYGSITESEINMPNGFYYVNHYFQSGGIVFGDSWSDEVEQELIFKEVISAMQ